MGPMRSSSPRRCQERGNNPAARSAPGARTRPAGFTLLETALATIIIGVGVLAVIEAQRAFLEKNAWSSNASTATFLANEIRERTRLMPRHDRFSGGLYYTNPADDGTFTGWGPEAGENTPADFDDLDDFDGAVFGDAPNLPEGFTLRARYPGPIDAAAEIVPETLWNGTAETITIDGETSGVPLRGWTQCVIVSKTDPADATATVARNLRVVSGGRTVRDAGQYPVRVTVIVLYQAPGEEQAHEAARVSWVASP